MNPLQAYTINGQRASYEDGSDPREPLPVAGRNEDVNWLAVAASSIEASRGGSFSGPAGGLPSSSPAQQWALLSDPPEPIHPSSSLRPPVQSVEAVIISSAAPMHGTPAARQAADTGDRTGSDEGDFAVRTLPGTVASGVKCFLFLSVFFFLIVSPLGCRCLTHSLHEFVCVWCVCVCVSVCVCLCLVIRMFVFVLQRPPYHQSNAITTRRSSPCAVTFQQ
jgi:hypothetical protein